MRKLRYAMVWIALHPRLKALGQFAGVALGIAGIAVAFYFHGQDSAKFNAQKSAQQAAAKLIDPVVCQLVYTYVNLPQATPNSDEVAASWRRVGEVVGCPDGTPPK